jgi:hypothetical protein
LSFDESSVRTTSSSPSSIDASGASAIPPPKTPELQAATA